MQGRFEKRVKDSNDHSLTFVWRFRPVRGMGAVVAGAGPAHALYFATYEYSKEVSQQLFPNHRSLCISKTVALVIVVIVSAVDILDRFVWPLSVRQ